MSETLWITTTPEFGSAHPHGCCAAFVGDTICGFPRRDDGTCEDGHPVQPADAPTHSIRDLLAAVRVREAQLASAKPLARPAEQEFHCDICGSDSHDGLGHGDPVTRPAVEGGEGRG